MTKYMVLSGEALEGGGGDDEKVQIVFSPEGVFEAPDARRAIRARIAASTDPTTDLKLEWVAVPAASWKPVKVTLQTTLSPA